VVAQTVPELSRDGPAGDHILPPYGNAGTWKLRSPPPCPTMGTAASQPYQWPQPSTRPPKGTYTYPFPSRAHPVVALCCSGWRCGHPLHRGTTDDCVARAEHHGARVRIQAHRLEMYARSRQLGDHVQTPGCRVEDGCTGDAQARAEVAAQRAGGSCLSVRQRLGEHGAVDGLLPVQANRRKGSLVRVDARSLRVVRMGRHVPVGAAALDSVAGPTSSRLKHARTAQNNPRVPTALRRTAIGVPSARTCATSRSAAPPPALSPHPT
jgi:hypothetical protein